MKFSLLISLLFGLLILSPGFSAQAQQPPQTRQQPDAVDGELERLLNEQEAAVKAEETRDPNSPKLNDLRKKRDATKSALEKYRTPVRLEDLAPKPSSSRPGGQ
jgi:hypothetical protein